MAPLPVLHVTSNGHAVGGMETNLETLLRFHNRGRVEPHVAFLTSGIFSERVKSMRPEVSTLECRSGRFRYPWRLLRTIQGLRRYIRENSIKGLIAQGIHAFVPASLAGLASHIPTILWVHGVIGGHELRGGWVRWGAHLPARTVIVNSNRLKSTMDAYYNGGKRVEMIYFGIDIRRFGGNHRRGNEARRKLSIPADVPVVLLPGRVTPWKGQDVLVRAAPLILERCPSTRFLIVGGTTFAGDADYARRLRDLAADLGVRGKVQFTGYWGDLPALYAAADVVVNASTQPEGFGITMIEAMASGKPVLASRVGSPEEIVKEGRTGFLFRRGDHGELAERVVELLRNRGLLKRMGRAARADAVERFSAGRMAREVEDVCISVADGAREVQ